MPNSRSAPAAGRQLLFVAPAGSAMRRVLASGADELSDWRSSLCASLAQASESLLVDPPSLIIFDVHPQSGSALELAGILAGLPAPIPCILVGAVRLDGLPHGRLHPYLTLIEEVPLPGRLPYLITEALARAAEHTPAPRLTFRDFLILGRFGRESASVLLRFADREEAYLSLVSGAVQSIVSGDLEGFDACRDLLNRPVVSTHLTFNADAARGGGLAPPSAETRPLQPLAWPAATPAPTPTAPAAVPAAAVNAEAAAPPATQPSFDDALAAGIRATLAHDLPAAQAAFHAALELRPGDPRAQHNLHKIEALLKAGKH